MHTPSTSRQGLTVKDLVTVGIFSALFLAFALAGGIFFAPNPMLTFYMPVGSALLYGPIYLLMLAKVQKRFAESILGAIPCVVWFVTAMRSTGTVWILVIMLVGTVLAAAISAFAGCKMLHKQFEKAGIAK